ncbi:diphthamide biosynthesis protein [Trichoderma longibrachiatum ATCC 18648]|uniref:2-(3-amino-3-carboxypropyl)histidine synthase subunit 2 n=1 Tax=Trichoderma longibrachiatum ATCC 18648 TaxID=983965 RepID=A0A2T4BXE3_TRILO|nr:diphthamide biosynthesis protein [Trichoderma longibrachiatum ATCC 18648]
MAELSSAPVLSTPEDHLFEAAAQAETRSTLSHDALRTTYEIPRTAAEIRQGAWKRVALQFPDHMLVDAPRVVEELRHELEKTTSADEGAEEEKPKSWRICILADTSYSACCVDEIAAEHANADVVVHYGRTCLSPTSRLPVIYVYTSQELDHDAVVAQFTKEFGDKDTKVVIMADLTYQNHVESITNALREQGYSNILATEVIRDPAGVIPNRRIAGDPLDEELLKSHSLFHISDPPASLLLALQSRFASLHVLSVPSPSSPTLDNPTFRTAGLLRRRFARVLTLASAGVVGILVNTLSVSNYLTSIELLRKKIAQAGKKSYTVVVGKLNPAKLANFAEIEGWVVVGCWESGLIEEDAGYWRPVITPFEMEVALMGEETRVWGGEWWGGIEKLKLEDDGPKKEEEANKNDKEGDVTAEDGVEEDADEDESLPPVFDLRTGKLVSHSRPMQLATRSAAQTKKVNGEDGSRTSEALVKRTVGELATINGVASPGAEYLRSQRTWQGLGTDFDEEASTAIEEGRSGIARGYHVGEERARH